MKEVMKVVLVVILATVSGYSVYANRISKKRLDVALTNIEALTLKENTSGVSSILTTDLGTSTKCENGTLYSVQKYRIDCFGSGNLPCQSGEYSNYTAMGPCQEVRTF